MPEIEIRSIVEEDLTALWAFEHGYYSEYVWQMNLDAEPQDKRVEFRRVRLPRRIFVPYPRPKETVFEDWDQSEAFLVAHLKGRAVGYADIAINLLTDEVRVQNLVVSSPMRRQGIASGLMVALMKLCSNRKMHHLLLPLQSKNDPAIQMGQKLGFEFHGYQDHYFPNQDLALFFHRYIR
jgi:ribosomal protein S18 acetylase RimI-like enzyme